VGTTVVWFKKDLRVCDHAPLVAAAAAGNVVPLFIYEPDVLTAADFSRRHLQFANGCLFELRRELRRLGGDLILRTGDAVEILRQLKRETAFTCLHSHQETGNAITYKRDQRVAEWCREAGVAWTEHPGNGVIRRLRSRDGWAGRWARRMGRPILEAPMLRTPANLPSGETVPPDTLSLRPLGEVDLQKPGTDAARSLLDSFLMQRGVDYTREMSSPVTAFDACSRLSPHLAWGTLSIREAYQTARKRQEEIRGLVSDGKKVDRRWRSSLRSFLGRLRWHCHFMQKLEDEPEIEFRNIARFCDGLREDSWDQRRYEAWRDGQTGYPMVDACMRALRATGWINFRMRAMLMSFASYHLWLHWRQPGIHLANLFTDFEPGIHWSQCQMQSGTTAINSIRIYSPIKQVSDHDPSGRFIRRWVPELEGVPDQFLPTPWSLPPMEQKFAGCRIGDDYPEPIVDHKTAYHAAQKRIRSVRRNETARAEAAAIQKKHGSRRRPPDRTRGRSS